MDEILTGMHMICKKVDIETALRMAQKFKKDDAWCDCSIPTIGGLAIMIVCDHDNGEQRRRHRKRRINKKWLKRYGVYVEPMEPNQILVFGGCAIMSRKTYKKIRAATKKKTWPIWRAQTLGTPYTQEAENHG